MHPLSTIQALRTKITRSGFGHRPKTVHSLVIIKHWLYIYILSKYLKKQNKNINTSLKNNYNKMNKINIYYIDIYILTNPVKKTASQSDIFFHLFLLFHRAAKLQSVLRVFVLVVVPFAFSDFDLLSLWKEVSIWKPNRVLHLHLLVIVFFRCFSWSKP